MEEAGPGIEGLAVVEMIGRGGFGAVYRARDEAHGRDVAVKVLPALLDDSARRQFDRERRAMGALSDHPGIGTVHTSGFTDAGEPYITMQLMQGGSLADRIADGPLPVDEALGIGAAMADALAAAHAVGVLHLDIKPENILFTGRGEPKLVDFGIAKLADDAKATSTIRATPAYAAPEVLEGQTATPAADVYSLGVTVYAAIMGQPPFSGDSVLTVLRRVAVEPVPEITRADAPPHVVALLRRAMDKSPTARPASMEQFADELRRAAATPPAVPVPPDSGASPSTVTLTGAAPLAAGLAAPTGLPGAAVPTPTPTPTPTPPPGAVPYTPPPPKRTGLMVGGVVAGVVAVIAIVALVLRGGDGAGEAAASTLPTTAATTRAEATPTTARPQDAAATTAPVTAAPTTVAPTTAATTTTAATLPATTAAPPPPPPPAPAPAGRITEVVWGTGLDAANRALPTGSYFPDGSPAMCVSWVANDYTAGSTWSIGWTQDGVDQPALGGSGLVAGPVDPYYACVTNDAGVIPGLYEVTWSVDGEVQFADSVYVGGGRPPITVTMINGIGSDVCRLNVSPSAANFWGRDVLGLVTIPIDQAFDVVLAAGAYDVRALTCDGVEAVLQTGIDFQASAPYVLVGG